MAILRSMRASASSMRGDLVAASSQQPQRRGRGRPRKHQEQHIGGGVEKPIFHGPPRRRGRPRKQQQQELEEEEEEEEEESTMRFQTHPCGHRKKRRGGPPPRPISWWRWNSPAEEVALDGEEDVHGLALALPLTAENYKIPGEIPDFVFLGGETLLTEFFEEFYES